MRAWRVPASLRATVLAVLPLGLGACLPHQAVLVQRGLPKAVVVIPDDANAVEEYAASELVDHVRQISGATLPLARSSAAAALPTRTIRVHVGRTNATGAPDPLSQGSGGFTVRTRANAVFLAGDDAPSWLDGTWDLDDMTTRPGTLFATYDLLQDDLGVRWIWPGEAGTATPHHDTVALPVGIDRTELPSLVDRELRQTLSPSWQRRYGNEPWYDAAAASVLQDQEWVWLRRHRMFRDERWHHPPGHAFVRWWQRFHDTLPEVFALSASGAREPELVPGRMKMCVSNPTLWDAVITDFVRQHRPGAVDAVENDSPSGFCTCERCGAWDTIAGTIAFFGKTYPRLSERYARFFNAVARRAAAALPGAWVHAYAYQLYREAPQGVQLEPNLVVGYIRGLYPTTEEEVATVRDEWLGWRSAGDHLLYWKPNALIHTGNGMPNVIVHQLAADQEFFDRHGADGADHDRLVGYWVTAGPTYYVVARQLWDIDASIDELLDEYYAAFGEAADPVRAYWDYWEGFTTVLLSWNEAGFDKTFATADMANGALVAKAYTPEVFAPAETLLDAAFAAGGDDEEVFRRLEGLRFGLDHARRTAAVRRLFDRNWRAQWMVADEVLPPARALLDLRRAELQTGWSNLLHLSWDEIRQGDRCGIAAVLDTQDQVPVLGLPWNGRFRLDPDDRGLEERWFAADPPENPTLWTASATVGSKLSSRPATNWARAHDWEAYRGTLWWRIKFTVPPGFEDRTHALFLPLVDGRATLWMNGEPIARRDTSQPGPMTLDVRGKLKQGSTNVLVGRFTDPTRGGGLQRPLWLVE